MGGLHCSRTCRPVGWTNLSMLFEMLKSIDHAYSFVYIAPEWKVVDDLMLNYACLIDKEESAVGDEFTFYFQMAFVVLAYVFSYKHIVVFRDCLVGVCNQRIGYALDATFAFGDLEPAPMGKFSICRNSNDYCVALFKLR